MLQAGTAKLQISAAGLAHDSPLNRSFSLRILKALLFVCFLESRKAEWSNVLFCLTMWQWKASYMYVFSFVLVLNVRPGILSEQMQPLSG